VLHGSPVSRFYERHGFVKVQQDDIEAEYERPVCRPSAQGH
jgi:predicted N-acetyltransferase YhbS